VPEWLRLASAAFERFSFVSYMPKKPRPHLPWQQRVCLLQPDSAPFGAFGVSQSSLARQSLRANSQYGDKPVGHVSGTFGGPFDSLTVALQRVKKDCQTRRRQFWTTMTLAMHRYSEVLTQAACMEGTFTHTQTRFLRHPGCLHSMVLLQLLQLIWHYCVCGWC
jgi:hypothetical protein